MTRTSRAPGVDVPEDLRAERVRDGYREVLGALPHVGERVVLSPMAGAQFHTDHWFVAERVENAYYDGARGPRAPIPGWVYVSGIYVSNGQHAREYVRVAGLRVERLIEPTRVDAWHRRHHG
jgi:hypothetical protein